MSKRNLAKMALLLVVAAGTLAVLRAEAPAEKVGPAKESLKECCKKKESGTDKSVWESLPQGFFSSI